MVALPHVVLRVSHLFVVTAIVELGAGVLMLAVPSVAATLLMGAALPAGPSLVLARVAGIALIALGIICARARRDEHSAGTKAIIIGLTIYHAATVLLLVLVAVIMGLTGPLLWPAVLLHAAMTMLCIGGRRRADMASTLSSYRRRVAPAKARSGSAHQA
jgi:hypothetical protein